MQHQIARGVPSGAAADFAADRADARSSGEVRFGVARFSRRAAKMPSFSEVLATAASGHLRPRNVAPCRFARQTITCRRCRPRGRLRPEARGRTEQ